MFIRESLYKWKAGFHLIQGWWTNWQVLNFYITESTKPEYMKQMQTNKYEDFSEKDIVYLKIPPHILFWVYREPVLCWTMDKFVIDISIKNWLLETTHISFLWDREKSEWTLVVTSSLHSYSWTLAVLRVYDTFGEFSQVHKQDKC